MALHDTVQSILDAPSWAQRIAQIRLVPHRHGTGEHGTIYAAVARKLYMPHLAPDFAYIHTSTFYDPPHFFEAYDEADRLTDRFTKVAEADLARAITECPRTLLVFRTLLGLTKDEFAHASLLAAATTDVRPLSSSQIDNMERSDVAPRAMTTRARAQAEIAAKTIAMTMNHELFGDKSLILRMDGRRSANLRPMEYRSKFFCTNGITVVRFVKFWTPPRPSGAT
jgi:hypothetical protein